MHLRNTYVPMARHICWDDSANKFVTINARWLRSFLCLELVIWSLRVCCCPQMQKDLEFAIQSRGEVIGVTDRFIRIQDSLAETCICTVSSDKDSFGTGAASTHQRRTALPPGVYIVTSDFIIAEVSARLP